MNYDDAIKFLNDIPDWEKMKRSDLRKPTIEEDLNNYRKFLKSLDNPHLKYPTIHIAGTCGKGSTAVMLAQILTEAGYKTGLYTSPHLTSYCERIKIDGEPISESKFARIMEILSWREEMLSGDENMRTVFEILTTLAFFYFAEEDVDIALIEAGLGGRYDSTIVINPVMTILTPIYYDHTGVLGESLEEITEDKAYTIREDGICITEQWFEPVKNTIEERKIAVNADVFYLSSDFRFKILKEKMDKDGVSFTIEEKPFKTSLVGVHQAINAGLAVIGASILVDEGFNITEKAIQNGLMNARIRGRFEYISEEPLIILDGAHNPLGMKLLSQTLKLLKYEELTLIIGMNFNKPVEKTLEQILPLSKRIIVVKSSHPLAMEIDELKDIIEGMGYEVETGDSIEKSLLMAVKSPPIVITGSLYLAGDYIEYLNQV
jgi:dihydrofolate synthase/folylpolyglutamate synthase